MNSSRWLGLAALALALLSLFLPAIEGPGFPSQRGMDILRRGASAWRDGVVAWYANPLLFGALIAVALARYRIGLGIGLVASVLALSSFTAAGVAASAGRAVPPFGFAIGFHVWLLAFVVADAAAALGIYKEWKSRRRSGSLIR